MKVVKKTLFACVLAVGLVVGMSALVHAGTYAVVTGEPVNVRSAPEIDPSNRLFTATRGLVVQIHDVSGDFFRASVLGADDVYISREWVRIRETQGIVTSAIAWLYDLPRCEGGSPIIAIPNGETLTVTSTFNGWFGVNINETTAFVEMSDVEIPCFVELPTARVNSRLADEIVERALQYLGTRYVWGGASPAGFDCSGFTSYIMRAFGISINRTASQQVNNGVYVSRCSLMPGDLVFFSESWSPGINHVGIYIGGGQMIHASTWNTGVMINNINGQHWLNTYVAARRVIEG